jgi:hypothetical protein
VQVFVVGHALSREAEFTAVALRGRTARVEPGSQPAKQVQGEHSRREQCGWGWFWHSSREDGCVQAGFVGSVGDLPPIGGEVVNVYPAIVQAPTATFFGCDVALREWFRDA